MSGTAWAGAPILQGLLLLPVAAGSLYSLACLAAMARLRRKARAGGLVWATPTPAPERPAPAPPTAPLPPPTALAPPPPGWAEWPPVSLLKPVYGLTRELGENLRSACRQDYPDFQVVLSAQREDEPALPLMYEIQREVGSERVTVVVDGGGTVPNGKVRNLLVGLGGARHDLLVISDADVRLRPDYLRAIVAPLVSIAGAEVGCATTLYKAAGARRWYEALEQVFFNADWVPNVVFAHVTGAQPFVLGASNAVRRSTLDAIGGLADLGHYLLEDFEMGRRIRAAGRRIAVVPYFVDMLVDLAGPLDWWRHQLYWDKNTRAGNAWGLFGTLFVRAVPFALAFAALRGGDRLGLGVAAGAVALRLATAGLFMGWGLGDRTGLRRVALVPLRDLAGFVSTLLAFAGPTVVWSGARFVVGRGGRMVAQEPSP
jgi:ceramide glucosyltransferase